MGTAAGAALIAIALVGIIAAFPFIIYLSVKLGTYAFFKARKLFQDEFGENNGKE